MGIRPHGFWRDVIYKALRSFGGQACLTPDIYKWILHNVALTAREKSPSPHNERPYYHNTIRGIASDMSDQGLLIRVTPGCYRIP